MPKINSKKNVKEKPNQVTDFIRTHWKGLLGIWGLITAAAFLSSKNSDDSNSMEFSNKWLKNATDDELDLEREKVRERYVDGSIDINEADRLYHTLNRFDNEMINRANEKYEEEHPNTQPRHREHGWYLPNDD